MGYNLDSGDTCLGAGSTGDQENTNPQLGSLGPHGGPGLTMAPAINSPAVDQGTAAGAVVDQRGLQRTFDMNPVDAQDGTDVGAFEQVINGVTGSVPFGSQQWGTTSSTQDVVISNRTGNPLSSGALSIAGTNPNDFQLSNDGCSTGSVPDNGTCTAKAAFSPISPSNGARSATVTFGTFSPAFLVNLSGTTTGYTPAAIGVAPVSKDFGSTQAGTPTAATEFVVNNTGADTSGVLTVALTGANASEFGITSNNCAGQTLTGGETCSVSVRMAPTGAGSKTASLDITAAPGGALSAGLTGTATALPTPPVDPVMPTPVTSTPVTPTAPKKCKKGQKKKKGKCVRKKKPKK